MFVRRDIFQRSEAAERLCSPCVSATVVVSRADLPRSLESAACCFWYRHANVLLSSGLRFPWPYSARLSAGHDWSEVRQACRLYLFATFLSEPFIRVLKGWFLNKRLRILNYRFMWVLH